MHGIMTRLTQLLPSKLIGRCVLVAVSLLLATTVFISWNAIKTNSSGKSSLTNPQLESNNAAQVKSTEKKQESNARQLKRSSNLILPNVVEAQVDEDLPHMYRNFEKNPEEFIKRKSQDPYRLNIPVGKRVKVATNDNDRKGVPKVNCLINNKEKVTCLVSKTGEVYMPFRFIKNYFEVYGELVNNSDGSTKDKGGKATFYFQHSTTPLFLPTDRYRSDKKFMYFGEYNVEGRTRVMLVSGVHGVPVSNQWDKAGYIYPIQVAQYGLSHHAKLLEEKGAITDRRRMLEDGSGERTKWMVPGRSQVSNRKDTVTGEPVVYFSTLGDRGSTYPTLNVNEKAVDSCLSFNVKFISLSANVSIVVEAGSSQDYVLTYHSEDFFKRSGVDNLVYGIGSCRDWCTLHRDVMVDLKKFIPQWDVVKRTLRSIKQVEVRGEGYIDNITISRTCHEGHFKAASDWIAGNQDANGGWPVPVTRVITTQKLTLPPGWYSAMGQGQAISLLVRAYITYKKPEYLEAAARGLSIYQKLSAEHGVRARFLDKYNWYEEYPTKPPLFILNGFIYSLFGLYDLTQVSQGQTKATAQQLFDDGMNSLKIMLPFYDSGIGTFYDLRHFTIPGIAPNRARWDYHAVHIAQLQNLGTLDPHPIFNATAARWIGYMDGEWAPHN